MRRIIADREKCAGYANCLLAAPDVFDLDQDGLVKVLRDTVAETGRVGAEQAARTCPTAAISIDREEPV